MLARQTVNVNQREKDLNIFYVTFLHNLHVNQGGKLTLQTDWNRTLLKAGYLRKSSLWIAPVPARLTYKKFFILAARAESCGSHILSYLFCKKAVQKALSWQLIATNVTGPWIQSSRPRHFKLSVKRTVDNNSYIRKNEKRPLNTTHVI